MLIESAVNTLVYDPAKCTNCLMCIFVCPHAVFVRDKPVVKIIRHDDCMECGACSVNCPTGALTVENGVGCAYAMMRASLTGKDTPVCC